MFKVTPIVEKQPFKKIVSNSLLKILFKEVVSDEREKKELLKHLEITLNKEKESVLSMRKEKQEFLRLIRSQEERLVKLEQFLRKLKAKTLSKEDVISEMKRLLD